MKKWVAMSGRKRFMSMWADTEGEAKKEIKRQLNRTGRRELYKLWVRDGRVVIEEKGE